MVFFKSCYFVILVFIVLNYVYQSKCSGVKDFVVERVVRPIQSILPNEKNNDSFDSKAKEHGSLDFFGRDIIRGTTKKFRDIKTKIQSTFSKMTRGLDCNNTLSGGKLETFKLNVQAIYPGTKWCGDGNISVSYDDLGKFSRTDNCCREHDLCPDSIASDSTKYGLINNGLFTRSHCDCDRNFYECLKTANTPVAKSIGFAYFSVLGPQCFRQDYPIVDCLEGNKRKCVKYLTDQYNEKQYQWFDNPVF